MRAAADRARRAVALRGGVWYNSCRSPQWEVKDPRRNETKRDTKSFPHPVNGLLRPAVSFTRLRGAVFANGGERP
jgi:hypothetical protein